MANVLSTPGRSTAVGSILSVRWRESFPLPDSADSQRASHRDPASKTIAGREGLESLLDEWRELLRSGERSELDICVRLLDGAHLTLEIGAFRKHDAEDSFVALDGEHPTAESPALPARPAAFKGIVGSSQSMVRVLDQVSRVARADSTVLLLGETGTGKELLAQAIHLHSNRSAKPLVRVNCAAIPQSLIASELFGHEKGAFTGAGQRRLGRFEAADGGTLFLDEVGDLPPETQVTLLRVLQEREIERVGSSRPIPINVRIVAATNRNLTEAVAAGTFRQDLFYRLAVFPIDVPALRQRPGDIPLLLRHFVGLYSKKAAKRITHIGKRTLDLCRSYHWPGNIRELQNVVERAVVNCEGDTLQIEEYWLERSSGSSRVPAGLLAGLAGREKEMIEEALARCGGKVSGAEGAAALLCVPRQTLEYKISSLGINKFQFKQRVVATSTKL